MKEISKELRVIDGEINLIIRQNGTNIILNEEEIEELKKLLNMNLERIQNEDA